MAEAATTFPCMNEGCHGSAALVDAREDPQRFSCGECGNTGTAAEYQAAAKPKKPAKAPEEDFDAGEKPKKKKG